MDPRATRLSHDVLPRRYDVEIDARVAREDFHGKVAIVVDVAAPRRAIDLHAKGLEIPRASARAGGRLFPARVSTNAPAEMITLAFDEVVPRGSATLEIEFKGLVSKGLKGLYLARDGPEVALATQCEEADARSIFPCFDEPDLKAEIAWRITSDAAAVVLANGPLVKVESRGDSRTWTFAPTRRMSSYLAALSIGDFAATPETTVRGVPMRVWALKGKERLGAFGNAYAAKLLPWFEDYFAAPYHFQKYDQIAVPGFAAGAMENAGLVLFRQALLIMDPKTASWRQEKLIARVVAHEMAHMWFGNLVTMRWWDDLWLNEAFAEWVCHKAVDALDPQYGVWRDAQTEKTKALQTDALLSTHPIHQPVASPHEATELFDAIAYYKGSAVLRMLESYLGEKPFRAGLRTYMKEFAEKNAEARDLWRHLAQASDAPVERIMHAWIEQPGHPVVGVRLEGNALHATQRRFLATKGASAPAATWPVPLLVRFEDDVGPREARFLLDAPDATLELPARGRVKWLAANARGIGFYRAHPDEALFAALVANAAKLDGLEQTALLEDEWGLARNGATPLSRFLTALGALATSTDFTLLERLVAALYDVEDKLLDVRDEALVARYRAWVVRTLKPALDEIGIEPRAGEPREVAQRRIWLLEAVAGVGHDRGTVDVAVALADAEAHDSSSVSGDLAGVVVGIASQFGDAARFERHARVYDERRKAGASPQEQQRYLNNLVHFRDGALVQRLFRLMDDEFLPAESIGPLVRLLLQERHSKEAAWDYLKANWSKLRERIGEQWLAMLIEYVGQQPAHRKGDVVAFCTANLKGIGEQSYKRAMETMEQESEFRARTRADLLAWAATL